LQYSAVLLLFTHYPFNIEASVFLNGVHWLLCIKINTMRNLLNEIPNSTYQVKVGKQNRTCAFAKYVCECGKTVDMRKDNVRSNRSASCGCQFNFERHGQVKTKLYKVWSNMKNRCYNNKNDRYKDYGGRGIFVCDSWRNSFVAFAQDMGNVPEGKTLDRIDNNGPYNKDNCKWSTAKEQARNRRTSKIIEYDGRTQSLAAWCDELKLNYIHTLGRINTCKWPIEKAFNYKTITTGD